MAFTPANILALRSLLAAVLVAVGVGCASQTRATRLHTAGALPPQLAVLPLSRSPLRPELADLLRQRLGNALEQKGYRRFDDAWVDQRLTQAGMQPWRAEWIDSDLRLVAFARNHGIAGLCVIEDFASDGITTGVYNERSLGGRLRVIDTARGETVWSYWLDSSVTGGAVLQSGQIFDAIDDTFGGSERANVVRFAGLVGLAASAELPRNEAPEPPRKRPEIATVRADGVAGAAADVPTTIEVVATGEPDCRGFASLPGCLGRYPLVEEAPGHYLGTLPVPRLASQVVVVLRDRFGVTSRGQSTDVVVPTAGGER